MKSIAIIVPYFGKLPAFYKAWEITAKANDSIDFYIFTDSKEVTSEKNIYVQKMSFETLKEIVQKQFSFKIELSQPYKLCDYKPAYGHIFKEWIGKYDFWGYCDIDMLLGELRAFFTEKVLSENERCSYLGHISLFKNTDKMNSLYQYFEGRYPALNYKDVFQKEESFYFDEARGMYTKCLLNNIRTFCGEFRDPITWERKFYWHSLKDNNQFIAIWENGKVFAQYKNGTRIELLYAHFFRRKFVVAKLPDLVSMIKVMPTKVVFNDRIQILDFDESEKPLYKIKYYCSIWKSSIKRYGIKKTIQRQKWSRDSNAYIHTVLSKSVK